MTLEPGSGINTSLPVSNEAGTIRALQAGRFSKPCPRRARGGCSTTYAAIKKLADKAQAPCLNLEGTYSACPTV